MYQHKQTRENYEITIDFINGYLTSIAKLKDKLSRYLGHTYFIEKLPKDGKELSDIVVDRISLTLDTFYKSNPTWTYDKEVYETQFKSEMHFEEQENWKKITQAKTETWLGLYSEQNEIAEHLKECFIINFVELIEDFFLDKKFKLHLMNGEIINDLYHHWGGIGFQDLFFETKENIYIIHFDYYD